MSEHIITTQSLTRNFGAFKAVNQLNLHVPEGSIYGFLGPNGAGKTTTIRMMLGLIPPSAGDVFIFDHKVSHHYPAIFHQVGALVEEPAIYPNLNGWENLQIYALLRGLKKADIEKALQTVRLTKDAKKLTRKYSTGMRQRLGLAIALLASPRLLILDEPTNGLDPAGMLEMRELLIRLQKEEGSTIFLSSHLLNEVEQVASVIGIVNKGKLVFEGALGEMRQQFKNSAILEVDKPTRACEVLTGLGWQVHENDDKSLAVQIKTREGLADIISQLVLHGIQVFRSSQERTSLEEVFLTMTEQIESI